METEKIGYANVAEFRSGNSFRDEDAESNLSATIESARAHLKHRSVQLRDDKFQPHAALAVLHSDAILFPTRRRIA